MKRKIIPIVGRFISKEDKVVLVALDDDGTVWEGCTQLLNRDDVKKATAQRSIDKTTVIPAYLYGLVWVRVPGLPDDISNLTRAK